MGSHERHDNEAPADERSGTTERETDDAMEAIDPAAETEEYDAAEVEESEIDVLRAQLAELQERLLRQQADFDNVRKRLRREMEEAGNRAVVRFVRPLLTEMDNFDRAIGAASPEAFQDFATGVSMIKANIDGILQSQAIEPIPAEGVFDPAVHEVIAEVEAEGKAKGEIVEVFRTGYRLGDQVIRAAQVVVAKAPSEKPADTGDPG